MRKALEILTVLATLFGCAGCTSERTSPRILNVQSAKVLALYLHDYYAERGVVACTLYDLNILDGRVDENPVPNLRYITSDHRLKIDWLYFPPPSHYENLESPLILIAAPLPEGDPAMRLIVWTDGTIDWIAEDRFVIEVRSGNPGQEAQWASKAEDPPRDGDGVDRPR